MTPDEKREWRSHLGPSLREVATGVPRSAFNSDAWISLGSGLRVVAVSLCTIGFRFTALTAYPISVIVLTPVLALSRVREQRSKKRSHEDFIRGIGGC